ncbi:MAG: ABC transporter ATP-binding protein [Candidatus Thiodiazotropha weberae]|nr:ABC transporter ATP-binding protein [Candidatus Thiodiazotropha lotti]MCG8018864.1 ABC transporter ATP-binding protein [Candidatus Thiodiazotropha lotti]MCW4206023.1 ABC transporter ATP-binding protein [Candidatus Thiodiazotropha lotti]MCW4215388.1 ABC transporter ATP-binding protein [Candidatus Thiodiazotropha lotti]
MIKLQQIDYHYPHHPPLFEGVNLAIAKGSLFGLLGPNGAGKTTLISLMTGQLQPAAGEIEIDGQSYPTQRTSILQKLAHIPQEYAFYPQLSVLENLQFFASLYANQARNRAGLIEQALALTGLTEQRERLAKHFSGGLKRRLNLAIGLLNKPQLIFLDEPTVGIDPQSRHFILQSIRELNKAGSTIVYTSHYMEEIEQLCDQVAIMDHGRILVHGPLRQILKRDPQLIVELGPISDQNRYTQLGNALQAKGFNLSELTISGHPKDQTEVSELLQTLASLNLSVINLSYGKHTLEKLFFELTQTHLRD